MRSDQARMLMWLALGGVIVSAAVILGAVTTFTAPATTRGHLLLGLIVLAVSFTLGVIIVALAD